MHTNLIERAHLGIRRLFAIAIMVALPTLLAACGGVIPLDNRHNVPLPSTALTRLASLGSSPREAMMIRIYKESSELEVWKRTKDGTYKLFDTYEICAWSGELGPKIKEGDRQAPEGFYTITPGLLNPKSSYYLSFNTGFPNKYDRSYGRTGTNLMVHGDCSSSGCYAMTDEQIKVVYALARESFEGGNASVALEMFPFRMTPENLARHSTSPNLPFWKNLKEGYDVFELTRRPPTWDVCGRTYVFNALSKSGQQLSAVAACPPLLRDENLTASLESKRIADDARFETEVAALSLRAAKEAGEAERAAKEAAALKARGEAIDGFVAGVFGSTPPATSDSAIKAPVPATRLPPG